MSYVLNSYLVSVTHTWGKACSMSQPSRLGHIGPTPEDPAPRRKSFPQGATNGPSFRALFFNYIQKEFHHHLPLPLAYGFKAKIFIERARLQVTWGSSQARGSRRVSITLWQEYKRGGEVWRALLNFGKSGGQRPKGRRFSPQQGLRPPARRQREEGPGKPSSVFTLHQAPLINSPADLQRLRERGQFGLRVEGQGAWQAWKSGVITKTVPGRGWSLDYPRLPVPQLIPDWPFTGRLQHDIPPDSTGFGGRQA